MIVISIIIIAVVVIANITDFINIRKGFLFVKIDFIAIEHSQIVDLIDISLDQKYFLLPIFNLYSVNNFMIQLIIPKFILIRIASNINVAYSY